MEKRFDYGMLQRGLESVPLENPRLAGSLYGRLNKEYIQILSAEGNASDKFWALEKRIYQDKRSPGVMIQLRRSDMPMQLLSMLRDGVIAWEDLKGFSPELLEIFSYLLGENGKKRNT